MANRISITFAENVDTYEALHAIEVCVMDDMEPGAVYTLTSGLAVHQKEHTKNPSFQVWRWRTKE